MRAWVTPHDATKLKTPGGRMNEYQVTIVPLMNRLEDGGRLTTPEVRVLRQWMEQVASEDPYVELVKEMIGSVRDTGDALKDVVDALKEHLDHEEGFGELMTRATEILGEHVANQKRAIELAEQEQDALERRGAMRWAAVKAVGKHPLALLVLGGAVLRFLQWLGVTVEEVVRLNVLP